MYLTFHYRPPRKDPVGLHFEKKQKEAGVVLGFIGFRVSKRRQG